jgi:hypothetical protein
MILGVGIAMIVVGLLALVRGRMTISKTKVVVGVPARLLGLLALTPYPIAIVAVLLYVAAKGGQIRDDDQWTLTAIEGGIVIGMAILVFVIGSAVAVNPEEAERRRRRDDYDDEDDRDRDEDRDDRDDEDRPRRRQPWDR